MKKIGIISILILLLTTSIVFINKNKSANATLDTVSLKEVEKNNMFAIMLQNDSGEYTEQSTFPEKGYVLNTEKSGCMDNNGVKIENSLTYDSESNKVTLISNKTSYCYLYFDKESKMVKQLREVDTTNTLSKILIGGMYRYQGTNDKVNNYICLGSDCLNQSDDMYRIIGVTPEGNIKIIKQTKFTNSGTSKYRWNENSNDSKCGDDSCPEWPESDIFTTLNNTFYNTLDKNIQNKIEPQKWWYGDMHFNFVGTLIANEVYQVETGQKDTKYYGHNSNNKEEVTDKRWIQMEEKANIGLMYLHDYYYQANQESCHSTKNNNYEDCVSQGWMHISKNGGTSSDIEWTMSREGRSGTTGSIFRAWSVNPNGVVAGGNELNNMYVVRPVFYLKNDIEVEGKGTLEEPFTIVTDLENTLRSKDTTKTLSSTLVGGIYRYQGTDTLKGNNVNNFICLSGVGSNECTSAKENGYDDNMYRIIGVTPSGNIKVMKQTSIGKYAWNTNYKDSTCGLGGGCPEWPASTIYTTLNGNSDSFLSKLTSGIQNKIEDWEWYYGDIYIDYANTSAKEIWKIETGQLDSHYYPKRVTGEVETGRWQKMSNKAKIGLMYLHDYYYQSTSDNCHPKTNQSGVCKDNGWMHMSKNAETTSNYEWTMTRVGRDRAYDWFNTWIVNQEGSVNGNGLEAKNDVRPVFYLTSDITLEGAGTTSEPFYIANS